MDPMFDTCEPANIVDHNISDILLPCEWDMYLYNKMAFKKMASKSKGTIRPNKKICTLRTLNDLIYILQLMKVNAASDTKKLNLDMNDYIFMRKGIEPIWEDPKNANGGTFSVKINNTNGYNTWVEFMIRLTGETLTSDMGNINGITVSYLPDTRMTSGSSSMSYTFIKIWDGMTKRDQTSFLDILSPDIRRIIQGTSIIYTKNNSKKNYGERDIINRIDRGRDRRHGGFVNRPRRR